MRKNLVHAFIFFLLNIFVLLGILLLNQDVEEPIKNITFYFRSVYVFIAYLFFSNLMIYEKVKNKKGIVIYLKTILKYQLLIFISTYILIVFISFFLNYGVILGEIFPILFQLFLISIIQSMIIIILGSKSCQKMKEEKISLLLIFFSSIYAIIYTYGNNIFFLNLYRYYFIEDYNINAVFHYIFWFALTGIIIYQQCPKNKKVCVNVRTKKNK